MERPNKEAFRAFGKLCVFCAKKPKDKTLEHIAPKWLLDITDTSRKGFDSHWDKSALTAFSSLVLPACNDCNNHFAKLEGQAKPIIEKLLNRQNPSVVEIDIILDWLDKVRVGLWIVELIRSKNPVGIIPKFGISDRVGQKDRFLKLSYFKHDRPALSFTATSTAAFHFSPSCFGIVINDLYIINCSFDMATSPWLGYPYAKMSEPEHSDSMIHLERIIEGTKEAGSPPWRTDFVGAGTYAIQPICSIWDGDTKSKIEWTDDYSKTDAISVEDRKGAIFSSSNLKEFSRLRLGSHFELKSVNAPAQNRVFSLANLEILKLQKYICSTAYRYPKVLLPWISTPEAALNELDQLIFVENEVVKTALGLRLPNATKLLL